MTMHCPHCRQDNASTTRFCVGCGAVLVESTKSGGRRRVLRPWGLRSSAPLTESPALPEMAAARRAAKRESGGGTGRRVGLVLAGAAGIVALSGVIAYPRASDDSAELRARLASTPASQVVAIDDLTAVREWVPVAAPVADPLPVMPRVSVKPPVAEPPARPQPRASPVAPEPAVPVVPEAPPDPRATEPPVTVAIEAPRAPADPWQALRDTLATCSRSQGLWERATCEQRARLAHCDGHWGAVALCPAGRSEFGQ